MSDELAAKRFATIEELKNANENLHSVCDGYEKTIQAQDQKLVRDHGEIRQLEERVEILTQQKHALEQINIGHDRELKRFIKEIEAQKLHIHQLIDECAVATLNKQLVEEQLEGLRLSIQQFMEKYTKK